MHADEVDTDPSLVQRLVAAQFPEWSGLPVAPVLPRGTDNANYRLGDSLLVRLPRREVNVAPLAKEVEWLPRLEPLLPLPVPRPIAAGEPGDGFPFPWAVCSWLDGSTAKVDQIADPAREAERLAAFVTALRRVDPAGAPRGLRRGSLHALDEHTRLKIAAIADRYDAAAMLAAWQTALAAPAWEGPPTWCHCDLDLRNLLFSDGSLCGVLDFGGAGIGDPACDAASAWKVLPADARAAFWSALGADEQTLARARGWLVFQCAMALSYYTPENNPALFHEAERWLAEALGPQWW
jgi:aminoglycoside phosphotransferase (APT) family kinase protein